MIMKFFLTALALTVIAYARWPHRTQNRNVEAWLDQEVPDWREKLAHGEAVTIHLRDSQSSRIEAYHARTD